MFLITTSSLLTQRRQPPPPLLHTQPQPHIPQQPQLQQQPLPQQQHILRQHIPQQQPTLPQHILPPPQQQRQLHGTGPVDTTAPNLTRTSPRPLMFLTIAPYLTSNRSLSPPPPTCTSHTRRPPMLLPHYPRGCPSTQAGSTMHHTIPKFLIGR